MPLSSGSSGASPASGISASGSSALCEVLGCCSGATAGCAAVSGCEAATGTLTAVAMFSYKISFVKSKREVACGF